MIFQFINYRTWFFTSFQIWYHIIKHFSGLVFQLFIDIFISVNHQWMSLDFYFLSSYYFSSFDK